MEYIKFSNLIKSTQYGFTADKTFDEDGIYKYLRITDIVPYFVDKDRVPFCEISCEKAKQYLVNEDDLLIARTGATTGYNLVVPKGFDNYIFASYLVRYFYDKDTIYPKYLKHVLKSQQWYGFVSNYIGGSAQPGMNPKTFGKFQFPIVDYSIQMKIADVLEFYDSLVENNNKRIKILEQMADKLYKEWFVSFRYSGYEYDSFIGDIPAKWKIARIKELGKIITGKTPSKKNKSFYGDYCMFVKTPDMHGNTFVISTAENLSEEGSYSQEKCLLETNSIMVSCIGTGGVVAINKGLAHTNQQINSIVLKNTNHLYWCYFTVKYLKEVILMYGNTGTTMTNLSKGKFEKIKILNPTDDLKCLFQIKVQPIMDEVYKLMKSNDILIKQRDLLLPRLMSGKLEIK